MTAIFKDVYEACARIVETGGDYLVTFRKVDSTWKQVAVCLS
jgi:hypothetical protein